MKHLLARAKYIHIRLHRWVGRLQKFFRAIHSAQSAIFHQPDPAAQQQRLTHIVSHKDDRLAQLLLELLELDLDLGPGDGIECAEGFVHQQDGRLGRQRSRQSNALPLSSGELVGISAGELANRQSYQRQHFFYAGCDLALLPSSSLGTRATFSNTV